MAIPKIFFGSFRYSNRFGILLDVAIDPSSGAATASVARSGVYDATQLAVDPSAQLEDFADRLREIGIFLKKLEMVGIIPVPLQAPIEKTERPLNPS